MTGPMLFIVLLVAGLLIIFGVLARGTASAASSSASPRTCKHCGQPVHAAARFCGQCGQALLPPDVT